MPQVVDFFTLTPFILIYWHLRLITQALTLRLFIRLDKSVRLTLLMRFLLSF